MYEAILINMPFAHLSAPSFALTQLRSRINRECREFARARVLYLNHEFAQFTGLDFYQYVAGSNEAQGTGLGEWLFRQAAFPEQKDNTDDYFQRYYPRRDQKTNDLRRSIVEKRQTLTAFLDEAIDRHGIDEADLVGFTSMFAQNVASLAMAKRLKERNPEIITTLGGANCESPMGEEYARHVEQLDFAFSGPALISFPRLVRHLAVGENEACHSIQGVFSSRNVDDHSPGSREAMGQELSIDVNVPLDYDDYLDCFEEKFPELETKPTLFFETSRGCWWGAKAHCTFCGLNGSSMTYRSMSPELAIEQFESLFRYRGRAAELHCVDNIMPIEYPESVLPALHCPPDMSLFYEVKASMGEDEFAALAKARVKRVQPGIEALATSTLKLMRKGTTAFNSIAFLKNCISYDIKPEWNLLLGFPGEEEDVFRKYVDDIPKLMHLPPPSGAFPVRFDRYSPYFVQAESYGLDLLPNDNYSLIYPFSNEVLNNIAYYFMDHNFGADYMASMVKWLSKIRARVALWRERWERTGPDGAPQLYRIETNEGPMVHDSREGKVARRPLTRLKADALDQLGQMKTMGKLGLALPGAKASDLEGALGSLLKQGLVFEERDRFISLVFQRPQHTWFGPKAAEERAGEPVTSAAPELKRISRTSHRVRRSSLASKSSERSEHET